MTRIKAVHRDGQFILTARGHAGDPLVCAAVSILCQALGEAAQSDALAECRASSGDYYLKMKDDRPFLQGMIRTALSGFELLANAFPENVRFRACREHRPISDIFWAKGGSKR